MSTVIAAGVQMSASVDTNRNIANAARLISCAADEGAKIICLPQLFNTRWFPIEIDPANMRYAEPFDGPTITAMRESAQKAGSVVIAPIFERDIDACYNSAFVIGPDGAIIGKYRKVHVPQMPLWEERSYFAPGNAGFPVFDTPFAKIGVQLCWDVFFPEGLRLLALSGAEAVFVPTASAFLHSNRKWERAVCAGAHANGVFVFRVNRTGKEGELEFYGKSFCARPDGEVLVGPGGASDGVVIAELDLSEIASIRKEWVFLKDRRPSEYSGITSES